MENSGFYNDNYNSGSSDDDLVDLSATAQDLLEDLPYDEWDHSAGRHAAQILFTLFYSSSSPRICTEDSHGLGCI